MADTEAPPKHTEQQILDLELARLSFSDLRALWEFTGGYADSEWMDVRKAVYGAMHERALKIVHRVRLVKAEEATHATT